MAGAAARSDPPGRAALHAGLHRAFAHWIRHDFKCVNWWYNRIGVPKLLAAAGLLMDSELNDVERDYLTKTLPARSAIGMTGQNRLWLAGNTLALGLLARDAPVVDSASEAVWDEVEVSSKEGVQPDFSFHQHGAQQQFGNYGLAFAVEVSRWAGVLGDSKWRMSEGKLGVLRRYLLDGQNWVSWRGAMDISACGRQLMPGSPVKKAATIALVMGEAARFDPAHAGAYRAFVARNRPGAPNDLVGDRYFWRSDYLVHRRPEFCFTLKMSSNRVIGAETTNGENKAGYHTADGALLAYRAGDEYSEIFPVWDWRKLPGVTAPQEKLPAFGTTSVRRDFVGAVSDGVHGVAALDYAKDGVTARKAWFFGADGVVALGSGVSGKSGASVVTTLNQCLLRGPVVAGVAGTAEPARPGKFAADWVEHDGLRYTVLDKSALTLAAGPVTGNWGRIFDNPATPRADVTANLFTLSVDHGVRPEGPGYAYAVGLAGAAPRAAVIANTAAVQAVRLRAGLSGVVFNAPGSLDLGDGRSVSADRPCVLLIDSGAERVFVADPTQRLKALTLGVFGKTIPVTLPSGGFAGATVAVPPE